MDAYKPMRTLQDSHRTYVRVATLGGVDGVETTRSESYRALHAIFHPPSHPHFVLQPPAASSAAASSNENEVAMDRADAAPSKAVKRGAAAAAEAAPAAKKPKPAEPEEVDMEEEDDESEEDWKATVYYWRGTLSFAANKLTWKGAWAGSRAGLPSDSEFAASPNEFTLTAAAKVKGGVTLSANAAELKPAAGIKGKFVGKYMLDQGDGLESFQDKTHMFKISAREDGSVMVAARGTTEFGAFVSAGKLDSLSGEGVQLTLARRYVDDADARKKWTTADVVTDKLLASPGAAGEPWTSGAMALSLS